MTFSAQEPTFYVGDVVMLNSGGPRMSVVSIDTTYKKVWCSWFNHEGKLGSANFPFASLTKKKVK